MELGHRVIGFRDIGLYPPHTVQAYDGNVKQGEAGHKPNATNVRWQTVSNDHVSSNGNKGF